MSSYSPSLVVHDFLTAGNSYQVSDFVDRIDQAMQIASDRVQAKYGVPCSRARATRTMIGELAHRCPDGQVVVESITPAPAPAAGVLRS